MPHSWLSYCVRLVDESRRWLGRAVARALRGGTGDVMAFDTTVADRLLLRRRIGWSERATLVLAAIAVALGAATWTVEPDQTAGLATAALPARSDGLSFEDRFVPISKPPSLAGDPGLQPLDASAMNEMRVRAAKDALARQLVSRDWRTGFVDEAKGNEGQIGYNKVVESKVNEAKPSMTAGIPLPRARPAVADLESRPGLALADAGNAARPDGRTLFQKLSDLLPGHITLASLTPDSGLARPGPDLASLGYEPLTAVYDITARAVYLPSGLSLEAHSGMGSLRDDPEHVSMPNVGATPPAVYELKPREKLFHGVQALRMIPTDGSDASGRSGLLTHSFMLGPNGDSNGCVSIRNYDRFLKAFNDGEINRLVVVPSLSGATLASQRSSSPS
jgi:hypothetical protein